MIIVLLSACAPTDDTVAAAPPGPTYWRDAKPILDAHCVGCHTPGNIAPFSLRTYEEVAPLAELVRNSVVTGAMPPWQPADGCAEYVGDTSLTDEQVDTLTAWVDGGAVEGDPADGVEVPALTPPFEADVELQLPEPYTPSVAPDDYHCQILEWPVAEPTYVVGLEVEPDQLAMVHHAIVFHVPADAAETFRAYDDADPSPGYTCFGGPRGSGTSLADLPLDELLDALGDGGFSGARWMGAWVPGSHTPRFPDGTGIAIAPGDLLVVQMHYNTSAGEPVADQSWVRVATAASVERPATMVTWTNAGWVTGLEQLGGAMDIPAGAADVTHETTLAGSAPFWGLTRTALGLPDDAPLVIHRVGHHMHQLGTTGRQEVRRLDGSTACLIDIPDWDFSWQGNYQLVAPVSFGLDDTMYLRCSWDNSAANQPMIDGTVKEPADVAWGEGTGDEMCLAMLYVTGP